MTLEDRVFSDPTVQELASEFVCVKIDMDSATPASVQHKSTRYVPELVLLDVEGGQEEVLERPRDLSVRGISRSLREALGR